MPPPTDDGKLDATNGTAYGELLVKPIQLPNQEIVGLGTTVITHSGIKIFRPVGSDGVEYKEDEITHDGETYGFDDGPNGIARLKDLDSYKNPEISAAALVAIDGINNAQDIATIKSTLTNFLHQFVIQTTP